MNIWEAYCTSAYYNIYFDLLVAKGMKREQAENVKQLYNAYLQRIKGTRFAQDLKAINNKNIFLAKLHEIFEIKWKNNIKYKEIADYFYDYLRFLDTMQALHKCYINNEEKARIKAMAEKEAETLSEYETEYMKDGKLVALMNPGLLTILHELIIENKLAPSKATLACKNYYGDLLDMSVADYKRLIDKLWTSSRIIKKRGVRSKIRVTYPDKREEAYSTLDALKNIVLFYGFDEVCKKRIPIRGEYLLCKYVTMGKEKIYESFGEKMFINNQGGSKDRMNAARTINRMFGEKLQIELI